MSLLEVFFLFFSSFFFFSFFFTSPRQFKTSALRYSEIPLYNKMAARYIFFRFLRRRSSRCSELSAFAGPPLGASLFFRGRGRTRGGGRVNPLFRNVIPRRKSTFPLLLSREEQGFENTANCKRLYIRIFLSSSFLRSICLFPEPPCPQAAIRSSISTFLFCIYFGFLRPPSVAAFSSPSP